MFIYRDLGGFTNCRLNAVHKITLSKMLYCSMHDCVQMILTAEFGFCRDAARGRVNRTITLTYLDLHKAVGKMAFRNVCNGKRRRAAQISSLPSI